MPKSSSSLLHPVPSLFTSQKLFMGFSPKGLSDSEISISPTSTLETKHYLSKTDVDRKTPPSGLALVDILSNDSNNNNASGENKLFVFGSSQLKVRIPSVQSKSVASPPQSPSIEFGVKTKDSQLALRSPSLGCGAGPCSPLAPELLIDMELSEEYTCVISHGPNPKTTHIFDNFIVESCDGDGFVAFRHKESGRAEDGFLSFCHSCKNSLSRGEDVFMHRGEKAFCSEACRRREMMFEEPEKNFSQDLSDLL
ncbi:uncharacterized protein A4U43_C08F18890 [Asparagus officinalis]|uniref:protein MARD1-like n=1 Tax=Asparagus officinalis TaxID=4686 RepID=UPI00098E136D|nr:protein MARD1-like [Asparagus officinalis]ONK60476.1 uncharacterized protein A4U43_C08F18890 [Asparagus officinalis]